MITITIGKRKYKGVYAWSDISLGKFCELASIPMPEGYEAYILADGNFTYETIDQYIAEVSKLTDEQVNITFPAYYRKVIQVLSNIPDDRLSDEQAGIIYEGYFKPFVVSLLYHTPVIHFMGQIKQYEPESVKSFRIGLKRFYPPESVNIMDQEIPLANEPIITYSEASDIFRGMKVSRDDVKRLALFMAIYCRGKGEQYDEKRALERQDLFMNCKMSIVWSVFFYTVRRLPVSTMIIQLFGRLPKQIREAVERVQAYQSTDHAD